MSRVRTYLVLFKEMFLLAAFVIGGGYVILTVADERFSRKRWIREGELFDMLPFFQMIPGIIGGHTAVYLGNRMAGAPGAAVALAGMLMPSILVFLAISLAYQAIPLEAACLSALFLGLRAALTGLLVEVVVRSWRKTVTGLYGSLAFPLAVAAILLGRFPPERVILTAVLTGVLVEWMRQVRRAKPKAGGSLVCLSCGAIPLLFLGYGLMAFGGGFVLVPAFLRDFVGEAAPYLQLAPEDFANVMALTEMTPGPVAANCATFFGYRLGGVFGAVLATAALVLPGSAILWLALRSLERFRASVVVRGVLFGVRPVTTALIACAAWSFAGMSIWRTTSEGLVFSPLASALAVLTLVLVGTRRVGAVPMIVFSALVACACSFLGLG